MLLEHAFHVMRDIWQVCKAVALELEQVIFDAGSKKYMLSQMLVGIGVMVVAHKLFFGLEVRLCGFSKFVEGAEGKGDVIVGGAAKKI